jgi:hypothetical protein
MGETFTLNELTNRNEVMKERVKDSLDADDMIFYHSLRSNLDLLQKKPTLQTIQNILDYSKESR